MCILLYKPLYVNQNTVPKNSKAYNRMRERKNYKKRYAANKKKQVESHKARRMMVKKYGKAKLKGKEVDHIKPQSRWGKTIMSNLRVISRKRNRVLGGKLRHKK